MKRNKVGVTTLYTGYNFGSSLQAYSLIKKIRDLGYDSNIITNDISLVKGRNVTVNKVTCIAFKSLLHPGMFLKMFRAYKASFDKPISEKTKELIEYFNENMLSIEQISENTNNEYSAFISGSDQIWNADTLFLNPDYFLRFAPSDKRIAYAPSMGSGVIPKFNKKKFGEYISEYRMLSLREKQSVELIKKEFDLEAEFVCDPTLFYDKNEWEIILNSNKNKKDYIFLYFLSRPDDSFLEIISKYYKGKDIYYAPYLFDNMEKFGMTYLDLGPFDFVKTIMNAYFVFTDSYHGTLFSANLNTNFNVLKRNYVKGKDESPRISSFLELISLQNKYIDSSGNNISLEEINFEIVNSKLIKFKRRSIEYLKQSLLEVTND